MINRLNDYLANGEKVHGWLNQYSASFIAEISTLQARSGIHGAVGEIGVHMGRLFIILKLTAMPGEKCFAIDVFGDQEKNTDHSGFGDLDIFLRNVRDWTGDSAIEVIQASSLDVKPDKLIATTGPCRFVSIDGGHTEECTYNDLLLAESVLVERGVAILDDIFNQMWPGVATGASKYFINSATKLRPFAITPNKLYLATASAHAFYRDHLHKTQSAHFNKTDSMFGSRVDIFGCAQARTSWQRLMRMAISNSPIGPYARFIKKYI